MNERALIVSAIILALITVAGLSFTLAQLPAQL